MEEGFENSRNSASLKRPWPFESPDHDLNLLPIPEPFKSQWDPNPVWYPSYFNTSTIYPNHPISQQENSFSQALFNSQENIFSRAVGNPQETYLSQDFSTSPENPFIQAPYQHLSTSSISLPPIFNPSLDHFIVEHVETQTQTQTQTEYPLQDSREMDICFGSVFADSFTCGVLANNDKDT